MADFKKLEVWQKAHALALRTSDIVGLRPRHELAAGAGEPEQTAESPIAIPHTKAGSESSKQEL